MRMEKRLLQINDLVIDSYDMVDSLNFSVTTKVQTTSYNFGNGSYVPIQTNGSLDVEEQQVSLTIQVDAKKIRCSERPLYKGYILENLLKPGKIWALEGTRILWAYFILNDYSESYDGGLYAISMDISVTFPEGVWHYAHPYQTFLKPYNSCDFNLCSQYREIDYCKAACGVCGNDCLPKHQDKGCCDCDCEFLDRDASLACFDKKELQRLYKTCHSSYQIIEHCSAGLKIFGDDAFYGTKICNQPPDRFIAGKIYSDTIKDTKNVTIRIKGQFSDPIITFNHNTIRILGEFNGILTLSPNMEATLESDCCDGIQLPPESIQKDAGSRWNWNAHPGNNALIIQLGKCEFACSYVWIEGETI